jgi:propionate CoA-transferase
VTKETSAADAVKCIESGSILAVDGFVGSVCPEELLIALEQRFLDTGEPRDLTVWASTGSGDTRGKGLDRLHHDGIIKRLVVSYLNLNRKLQKRLVDNKIEGFLLPLGVMVQLYREIAAGRPGLVTHVGLGTFVDPRHGGGRVNSRTEGDIVKVVEMEGREWLLYPTFKPAAGLLRGSTADEDGNISMEREIATFQGPSFAQAVHNSGGKVIAQVEKVVPRGELHPRRVVIPGHLVDHVVVSKAEHHRQTFQVPYSAVFAGDEKADIAAIEPMPLDIRKLVGRRAAMELRQGDVVNLGVGYPEFVATVAREEEVGDLFTLTVESGATGGFPAYGLSFGAAINPTSVIDHTYQFDFYDGGGLDITFVGLAQMDLSGNVNVSRLANRVPGIGGFFNVTQSADRVVFCGQFTAGESDIVIEDGKLVIRKDGSVTKFVEAVEQITFNASVALRRGQTVMAVTERAVFKIDADGPVLIEIAPGVDLEQDIMAKMAFRPRVADELKQMDKALFESDNIGLQEFLR